ncbi:MAG: HesB/IscA family protein [Candidatus Kariarchaeaceae archaeon]|jgi:iron-sulfur cluster assembly accessory protein
MSGQETIDDKTLTESKAFVTISETALSQLTAVITQQDREDLFLRLYVQGAAGGISFGMALDSRRSDDDHTCEYEGVEVAIDRISFPYLDGASVDYVEDKDGGKSGFQISSPNADLLAASGGGCGSCSGGAGCC